MSGFQEKTYIYIFSYIYMKYAKKQEPIDDSREGKNKSGMVVARG